jgi:Nucleoside 2-deoxyribosyltransferase/pfkB family carbohydrate kinase
LGLDITFVTAVSDRETSALSSIAKIFGFKYSRSLVSQTIQFLYDHGLSVPTIWPPLQMVDRVSLAVSADCVLQFGMLDADVEIEAQTVIYDPQDPFSPQPFRVQHRPRKLACVLNGIEARKLGSNDDLSMAAANIIRDSKADVVVVKRGPRGVLIFQDGRTEKVPAFETHAVWPIGSGDVFAGVFAARWGVQGASATDAAKGASRAAAEYVENRTLPIPRGAIEGNTSRKALNLSFRPLSPGEYDVYLAGPFFNMPQLWLIHEAREALRGLGLIVFSPYHDVGIGRAEQVAQRDIQALEKSRAVLAMVDGMDAGTIFEVGFARARSNPVVAFAQCTPEEPLKMIRGTGCQVVGDFVSAVYRVAWEAWR